MASEQLKPRIFRSLSSGRPLDALADLVLNLADEGLSKKEIVDVLQSALLDVQGNSEKWMEEGVIGDIVDMLLGFFVPSPDSITAVRLIERFSEKSSQ